MFAHVQCGDETAAQAALARAMAGFGRQAATSPLSAWPADFWAGLLAQPELVGGASEVPELAPLGQGPRAALLLRMVAGLDFVHAARVLGVEEATYRYALQRALQQAGEAGISYAALSGLRERLHRQVKTLPPARTAALERLREQALTAASAPVIDAATATTDAADAPPPRARALLWLLWVLLAAVLVAFAATFLPDRPTPAGQANGLPEELPPETPVPLPARGDAEVLGHPDYAQLAAPDAGPVAAELPLLSWLAANPERLARAEGGAAAPADHEAAPAGFDAGVAPPSAAAIAAAPAAFADLAETPRRLLAPLAEGWPRLEPATRARLIANAGHWQALDAAGRDALKTRMDAWDALPAPERAQRRAPFAAWLRLPPREQAQLRGIASRFRALPDAERQVLRAEFDALPAEARRDWWLGPTLGGDFAGLQPLVAFVADDDLGPVLAMLRGLPSPARRDLAEVSRRLSAGEREALRDELLAAPAENREALIRGRLGR
ncbi:DUF3106 domain-containing protein [Arenimonas composti]|uniref:DUF3106 domain-containing protein n=1 Tax=Arenimonas composti TaxID=370776 RepID=UPI0004214EAC|nr:DUF3106 domain-containing protein [Arenimonas composti]